MSSTNLSDSPSLLRQLEELQLIRSSLLPGERLIFLEDAETWDQLLDDFAPGSDIISAIPGPLSPPQFQIKLNNTAMWFEVEIPNARSSEHPSHDPPPIISVKGENVSRIEQETWQRIVKERLQELSDTEFPTFQLITIHLLPLLHERHEEEMFEPSMQIRSTNHSSRSPEQQYHALLASHHLISPNKRRSLQQWSSSLSITGFAKIGYPGVIYAQGAQENLEEFVANVKAMQWLALKIRFIEPLQDKILDKKPEENKWHEFQKIGEVVEEMRRIGQEEYIVEMGIGSTGTK